MAWEKNWKRVETSAVHFALFRVNTNTVLVVASNPELAVKVNGRLDALMHRNL
jgi:hypothetical protein